MVMTTTDAPTADMDRVMNAVLLALDYRQVPRPRCVAAAALGVGLCRSLGIVARAEPVHVQACNFAWVEWMDAGAPDREVLSTDPRAWDTYRYHGRRPWMLDTKAGRVINQDLSGSRPWAGHLAVRVGSWWLDADCGSMDRPERELYVPLVWRVKINRGPVAWGRSTSMNPETLLWYQPDPENVSYKRASDWALSDPDHEMVRLAAVLFDTT
jgi:hypothetical protein